MAQIRPLPSPGASSSLLLENVVDFNGGLNTTANRFDLKPNETPDCNNVDIDRRGGIIRRAAATTSNDATATIVGFPGLIAKGSSASTLNFSNRSFSDLTDVGTAQTRGEFAWVNHGAIAWSFGAAGWPSSNSSLLTNYTYKDATLATWSGIGRWQDSFSAPSGSHAPDAYTACFHLGYTFVGCTIETKPYVPVPYYIGEIHRNRLRWSHPGDGGSWRTDDYIDIGADLERITAVIPVGDHLLILKQTSAWVLHGYDADTFNLVNLSETVGCSSFQGARSTPTGGVYFFDRRQGLCVYAGGRISLLSEKVISYFPPYTPYVRYGFDAYGDLSEYDTVTVAWSAETGRVWVGLPDSTSRALSTPTNAFSLVYDPSTGAWTRNDIKSRAYFLWRGKLHGVWLDKTFYVEDETATRDTYLGTNDHIDGYWVSRWHVAGQPVVDKRWTKPEFVLTGNQVGTFVATIYKDYDPITVEKTITISTTNPLSSTSDYDQVFRTQVIGNAKAVAIKFTGPTTEHVLWRLDGYTLKYKMKPARS